MIKVSILERKFKAFVKNVFVTFGYKITRLPALPVSGTIVRKKIGNYDLSMDISHQLPSFLKHFPYYSQNLPRIALELFKKYPDLKMIDVGANIGDTVALVKSKCDIQFACFDGDTDFYSLLKENMKQFDGVKIYKQLLGEKNETISAELKKNIETSRLKQSGDGSVGVVSSIVTLDSFIQENSEIENSKLFKIDTDGYDMKIVRGALGYIKKIKPVIFLEYDQIFFHEMGDKGVPTLITLEGLGYDDIIFYDNFGKLIVSGSLSNHLFLKQMNNYIDPKTRTPFPYYDIAVFHNEDKDVAQKFIESEMSFFYNDPYYAK